MSVSFTQLKQTIDLAEKVKVDSGEKIVKTEKVGRSKKIEVTITTKGGKFFVYFDSEKYAGSYRSEKDADKIVKDYLKLVGEELTEVRGKVGSSDGDEEADKNIMMQLRKVVSLRGMKPVTFNDNKKAKVNPKDAEKLLSIYDRLKPASKMQLQTVLAKSKKDFDNAVKQLAKFEEVDLEEGALSDKWRKGARSVKVGKFELVRDKSGVHKILKDRKPFGDLSLDDEAGMWVGNMKGMRGQWVGREIDDLFNHLKKAHEELEEGKSSTGYELYHRDFSSAMKHAYDFAKKKFKIDVDPKEIDDKVASGPRKPSKGKTNSYRLLDKDGKRAIQVQVYGMDNGKYELNMYKEEVELDEAMQTWEVKVTKGVNKLKAGTVVKVKARNTAEAMRKAGKEFGDPIAVKMNGYFDAKPIKEELEEKYTAKQYKMAFGVLNDPRWKGGNMTRIVNTIEKIAKGLSKDKAVARAIQLTNESLEERELTPAELKKREKIAKDLPDDDFKKRYGDDWMSVKMGTATNMAKGES